MRLARKLGGTKYVLLIPRRPGKRSGSCCSKPWSVAGKRENPNQPDTENFDLGEVLPKWTAAAAKFVVF